MKQETQTTGNRAPLLTFLVLVTLFAPVGYAVAFAMGDDNRTGGIFLVQFAPLVAAFCTKIIFQRNLRRLGWRWGKTRYQLAVYGLGFLLPLASFILIWGLGFGGFYNVEFIEEARTGLAGQFGINLSSPFVIMLVLVAVNGTLGMLVALVQLAKR